MAVRDARASHQQLKMLFEFMVEHREFAYGRLVGQQGKKKAWEMWESLSASLNSLGSGPPKPAFKWQKCWNDWRNNVKKKAKKLRAHANGTGDGPPHYPLTETEQRLFKWMTPESVEGDTNVPKAGGFSEIPLEINFDPGVEIAIPVVLPETSRVTEGENHTQHSENLQRMKSEIEAIECESELTFTQLQKDPPTRAKKRITDISALVEVEEKRIRAEETKLAAKEKQLQQEDRRIALEERRIALEERREAREERRETREERREAREERRETREERREAREERRDTWLMALCEQWMHLKRK